MKIKNIFSANTSGIYRIYNNINGDCYIGSATNFNERCRGHIKQLMNNKHHSIILQRAVNKYNIDNFIIELILPCKKDFLIFYEQLFIDELKPKYNICHKAGSVKGLKWNESSKNKIKIQRKGMQLKLGKNLSNSHKIALSKKMKGIFLGEKNPFYKKTHINEAKEKIRKSKLGKKASKETKEKMASKKKKEVIINNEKYSSISEAIKSLNICYNTYAKNIKNYEIN